MCGLRAWLGSSERLKSKPAQLDANGMEPLEERRRRALAQLRERLRGEWKTIGQRQAEEMAQTLAALELNDQDLHKAIRSLVSRYGR
jgi:hypothetical protein